MLSPKEVRSGEVLLKSAPETGKKGWFRRVAENIGGAAKHVRDAAGSLLEGRITPPREFVPLYEHFKKDQPVDARSMQIQMDERVLNEEPQPLREIPTSEVYRPLLADKDEQDMVRNITSAPSRPQLSKNTQQPTKLTFTTDYDPVLQQAFHQALGEKKTSMGTATTRPVDDLFASYGLEQ